MAFANHLRQLRKAAGLEQTELQDLTGIAAATISRLENGKRLPTVAQLQKLASVLHTSMDMLMGRAASPMPLPCQPDRCPYLQELTTLLRASTERLAAAAQHPLQEVQE